MMHACCPVCRLRFGPTPPAARPSCPRCDGPLEERAAQDSLGCRLWAPVELDLDALARAVADVLVTPGPARP